MRHLMSLVVAAALMFGACSAIPPRTRSEQAIRHQYDLLEQAFAARDIDAVLASRAPDFETFGPNGERNTTAQMREYTRQWFVTNQPPIHVRFTIKETKWVSDTEAVVIVLQEATRYQDLAGKRRLNRHEVVQDETWIQTPAGWRIRKVENIRDKKRWIDGKRVDPAKPYDPDAPEFSGP